MGRRASVFITAVSFLILALAPAARLYAGSVVEEINPDVSTMYEGGNPYGASGGRINNLAAAPGSGLVYYAASEWGGLWKTGDGGNTWDHVDGHVPNVTWDVIVDPTDPNRVYATSLYDGRIRPISGIEVSRDEGQTWFHPQTATPAGLDCVDPNGDPQPAPGEWSGFGIGIQPDAPQNIFVGTTCGVAISNDSGSTWHFVDPTPNTPGRTYTWDVAVQGGGQGGAAIVDVCGDDFHSRSKDGGHSWEQHALPYPLYGTGRCSLAVSPDEPYVVLIVDDITDQTVPQPNDFKHNVYESDDEGRSWIRLGRPTPYKTPDYTKRLTFLEANDRADTATTLNFDLWYGEGALWRAHCETPIPASEPSGTTDQTLRCDKAWSTGGYLQWAGPPGMAEENLGAHGDSGDLVFDPTQSVDACPVLYASDGGVFRNTKTSSPGCHDPVFDEPDRSPHALWLLGMAGSNLSGDVVALHFGVQDDGSWATAHAEAPTVAWIDGTSSDSWDRVADSNRYLWSDQDGLHLATPGTLSGTFVSLPTVLDPNGVTFARQLPGGGWFPKIDQYGDKKYVILTDFIDLDNNNQANYPDELQKVYVTDDITQSPGPNWSDITSDLPAAPYCGVRASVDPSNGGEPVFFAVQGTDCNDNRRGVPSFLYKRVGTSPSASWQQVPVIGSSSARIGVFAVDPTDARRLYISSVCDKGTACMGMRSSDDGGATWRFDQVLTDMMMGKGLITPGQPTYDFINLGGPDVAYGFRSFPFTGYAQASLVAYDPYDPNVIVAGGKDSGVFLSTDGGNDWGLMTEPIDPDPNHPHISQPWFAHFKHDAAGTLWIYIGTRGRGVWRIAAKQPVADIGGPYSTMEGTDVTLNAGGSSDPDGQALSYEWDLDGDGVFELSGGSTAVFDQVGQDGVYDVSVKVTAGGVFSIATTTVTVTNVPPTVTVSSDAPQDENSAITVSGFGSDPGWLDPLTATIDWGDGSSPQAVSGVYENVRPDATLSFMASHVYGDNGSFTAKVCVMDDDTSTCTSIVLGVDNVSPTAAIDTGGAVPVNGNPTFIAHAGAPVDFTGESADPGSDDLALSWDWDDGPPAPDVTTNYLVNPPNPDPFPSPSIQPRDVTDTQTHAFGQACLYDIVFSSLDDDGGSGADDAAVVIVGNSQEVRSAGYWQHQVTGGGSIDIDAATLQCYLDVVGYMSQVFSEVRPASTAAEAAVVLQYQKSASTISDALDRELLAAWLNFANGSLGLGDLVSTEKGKAPEALFGDVLTMAESVRLDPNATDDELEAQKDILEWINTKTK